MSPGAEVDFPSMLRACAKTRTKWNGEVLRKFAHDIEAAVKELSAAPTVENMQSLNGLWAQAEGYLKDPQRRRVEDSEAV